MQDSEQDPEQDLQCATLSERILVQVDGRTLELVDVTQDNDIRTNTNNQSNKVNESVLQDLKELEKDLSDLRDIMQEFRGIVATQGERINTIAETTVATSQQIVDTIPVLKQIQPILEEHSTLKSLIVAGSCAVGGLAIGAASTAILGGITALAVCSTVGTAVGLSYYYIKS